MKNFSNNSIQHWLQFPEYSVWGLLWNCWYSDSCPKPGQKLTEHPYSILGVLVTPDQISENVTHEKTRFQIISVSDSSQIQEWCRFIFTWTPWNTWPSCFQTGMIISASHSASMHTHCTAVCANNRSEIRNQSLIPRSKSIPSKNRYIRL